MNILRIGVLTSIFGLIITFGGIFIPHVSKQSEARHFRRNIVTFCYTPRFHAENQRTIRVVKFWANILIRFNLGYLGECDADGDGVPDNLDKCTNDPNKSEPGQCGCGNPDTDADDDGTADCNDLCPNGILDPGEECDDGNDISGDGCSSACTLELVCGDGIVEAGEECDDGNDANGDGCSNMCLVENGWACEMPGEPCRQIACGDGTVDADEECDPPGSPCDSDADGSSDGTCDTTCQCPAPPEALCGDGVVSGIEACDDGNATSGDGCSNMCLVENGWACEMPGEPCRPITCGNQIVEVGEECDPPGSPCDSDADGSSDGTCDTTCQCPAPPEALCGDGVREASENCDGPDLGGNTCVALGFLDGTLICDDSCNFDTSGCVSVSPTCGDGNLDAGEECDDGNNTSGDGCSSACALESVCGNGVLDASEKCDGADLGGATCITLGLGFSGGTLICDASCNFDTSGCVSGGSTCGDGVVEGIEECDDGNTTSGDGCSSSCTLEALVCDPGAADCDGNPANGCETDISNDVNNCGGCGNICPAGEQCNNATCQVPAGCTDQTQNGDETDVDCGGSCSPCAEGNGCSINSDCQSNFCGNGVCQSQCGDGIRNGNERCDAADLGGATCIALGFSGGTLICDASCNFDTSGCVTPTCGDGTVDAGEECDDGNTVSGDGCSSSCTLEALVCDPGAADCDGNTVNGCETDISNDVNNCGMCGSICFNSNGTSSCTGGVCVSTCAAGFGDCDGNPGNGCETNITNDVNNCGGCGNICLAGEACNTGMCQLP